jgi:hypothetical protein
MQCSSKHERNELIRGTCLLCWTGQMIIARLSNNLSVLNTFIHHTVLQTKDSVHKILKKSEFFTYLKQFMKCTILTEGSDFESQ